MTDEPLRRELDKMRREQQALRAEQQRLQDSIATLQRETAARQQEIAALRQGQDPNRWPHWRALRWAITGAVLIALWLWYHEFVSSF